MQVHGPRAVCETCSGLMYLDLRQVDEDQPEDGSSLGEKFDFVPIHANSKSITINHINQSKDSSSRMKNCQIEGK